MKERYDTYFKKTHTKFIYNVKEVGLVLEQVDLKTDGKEQAQLKKTERGIPFP